MNTEVDNYFKDNLISKALFEELSRQLELIGPTTIKVSKSQIAFKRRLNVAIAWMPGKYLKGKVAPLVLTLTFRRRMPSERWKEVVEIDSERFTHHLEIYSKSDIDKEVKELLREAWNAAA